jgi:hypothetical protein
VETGVHHAFLIYPAMQSRPIAAQIGEITVHGVSFDISSDLDFAGNEFLSSLQEKLAA